MSEKVTLAFPSSCKIVTVIGMRFDSCEIVTSHSPTHSQLTYVDEKETNVPGESDSKLDARYADKAVPRVSFTLIFSL